MLADEATISYVVSPPAGSVVVDFEGPTNKSFMCEQFSNSSGNVTQVSTLWSYRLASDPGSLKLVFERDREFEISGTANPNMLPSPTYRNVLTVTNLTLRLSGVRLICGQGDQSEVVEWIIQIYRKLSLSLSLSFNIANDSPSVHSYL